MSPSTGIANLVSFKIFFTNSLDPHKITIGQNKNVVIAFIQTKLIATRAACIYCELLHNGMETKCMHLEYMYSNCVKLPFKKRQIYKSH